MEQKKLSQKKTAFRGLKWSGEVFQCDQISQGRSRQS